jgi:hypothetical protein
MSTKVHEWLTERDSVAVCRNDLGYWVELRHHAGGSGFPPTSVKTRGPFRTYRQAVGVHTITIEAFKIGLSYGRTE